MGGPENPNPNSLRKNVYRSLIFFGFFFYFLLSFGSSKVSAATKIYTGANNGLWETDSNWDFGIKPNAGDDAIIGTNTVRLSAGQTADFSTLTVTNSGHFVLEGNINNGGSIIIGNTGVVTQSSSVKQTLTGGGLTIHGNGTLRHATNTTALAYFVNFSASNMTINSGGQINVDGTGFAGGSNSAGSGPGGGSGDSSFAGGGAYGGNGGNGNVAGGVSYCDPTSVTTTGSGGGGTVLGVGGNGGGLIVLEANTLLTINGAISAKGQSTGSSDGAGGSGGGIKLTATTIAGTPTLISVQGGDVFSGSSNGAGGGGCVYASYSNTNAITSSTVIMRGGNKGENGSGQTGGAGQLLIKKDTDTYGDLYIMSTSSYSNVASTTIATTSLTVKSLSLFGSNVVVSSTYSLNLASPTNPPMSTSTGSSTLKVLGTLNLGSNQINGGVNVQILNGGTFSNSSTIAIATSSGLRIDSGATISNTITNVTSSGDLYITRGGTFTINTLTVNGGTTTLNNYTTSTARLELTTLNINSGALTHEDNSTVTATVHTVNLSANNITIAANGAINVDGKGYDGGSATGTGPGGGGSIFFTNAGGGGHGGDGGKSASAGSDSSGISYCNATSISTIGSGGGSATTNQSEGAGGGLIILNVTSTLTINGIISAQGNNGGGNSYFAGGSGGGIKLTADTIAGSPSLINVVGGEAGGSSAGGGGGGCVQISYTTSNSITSSTVALRGGSNNDNASGVLQGGSGQLFIKKSSDTYGDLYVINTSTAAVASTTQTVSSLSLKTLSLQSVNYVVPSSYSLSLLAPNATPLATSTITSTLKVAGTITLNSNQINGGVNVQILNGGTFSNSSTIAIATSSGLRIDSGATISNTITNVTSSGDLYITRGGTFTINTLTVNGGTTTLNNYTTSTARLELTTLNINSGALTHEDNSTVTATVHTVNLSANNITIAANGAINVDGKGYDGGSANATGTGPGGGGWVGGTGAGGGGHGGAGGAGAGGAAGGAAYCSISNVNTIGSGGGSGAAGQSDGDGGGLIMLNATSTLNIAGTISARGRNAFGNVYYGGGSGGGIKLVADVVTGTPTSITVVGGNDSNDGGVTSGGGGGGCVQVRYTTSNSITTSTVSGGTGVSNGSPGLFSAAQAASATNNAPIAPTSTSDVNTSSIRYNWTSGAGDETYYVLDRSTNGTNFTFVATSSPTSTTNYTFTGLSINTRYWLRVASGNGTNATSSYVTSSPVYTLAATPEAPSVVTSTVTSTLSLTIDAITINGNPQTASTTYVVKDTGSSTIYYLQSNGTWGTSTATLTYAQLGSGSATTTTGLLANSLHTISVAAINGDSVTTSYGSSGSSYTLASTSTGESAVANSATQITVSWSGNGTNFYIENITASSNSGWVSGASYAFSSLTCNTSYSFRIKSRNGDSVETGFGTTTTASTSACPTGDSGNNGGGGGGGGGGWNSTPTPVPTSSPVSSNYLPSNFPANEPVYSSDISSEDMPPSSENPSAPILPSDSTSPIALSQLASSNQLKPNTFLTYTYSYKNTGKLTERFTIVRTVKNVAGKVVLSGSGTRVLKPKQSFAYTVRDKLPSTLTDGKYTVAITILDSKKKVKAVNGFIFYLTSLHKEEIVAKPIVPPLTKPALITFSKIPTTLKQGGYLTYTYGFKNNTSQMQTFRILREVINTDTQKVVASSKGYRSLKSQQSFSYNPKDLVTKQYSKGEYEVKITIYDASWKKIIAQNEFGFEVK